MTLPHFVAGGNPPAPPPVRAEATDAGFERFFTPVQLLQMKLSAESTGNSHFRLLGWLLKATAAVADELLDQHGAESECGCAFCSFETAIAGLREDVTGIRWLLDRHADAFVDNTRSTDKDLTGTPAERLRAIADELDRLDARYESDDEPTTVVRGEDAFSN